MQTGQQNPYDFIMNAPQAPKKGWLPGIGSSQKQRILVVIAGGVLLIIILLIVFSLIFGGSGGNTDALVKVAQEQTELIRISDIALTKARGSDALNLAVTTKLSLTTEQQPLLATLKSEGRKLSIKELNAGKNSATDESLAAAEQNNQFDQVFIQTLQNGIANYQKTLKQAYDGTSSKKVKQTLNEAYTHATTLFPAKTEQSSQGS
jgi:hypothetical protein